MCHSFVALRLTFPRIGVDMDSDASLLAARAELLELNSIEK
jgi:hypothetical protein